MHITAARTQAVSSTFAIRYAQPAGHCRCSMAGYAELELLQDGGGCQPLKRRNAHPLLQLAKDNRVGQAPLLRTLLSGLAMVTDDRCLLTRPDAPLVDFCDWPLLLLHPLCAALQEKPAIFKKQGAWFLDDASKYLLLSRSATQPAALRGPALSAGMRAWLNARQLSWHLPQRRTSARALSCRLCPA